MLLKIPDIPLEDRIRFILAAHLLWHRRYNRIGEQLDAIIEADLSHRKEAVAESLHEDHVGEEGKGFYIWRCDLKQRLSEKPDDELFAILGAPDLSAIFIED